VDVNLSGVQSLVLEVNDGDDGIGSDHADWVDAKFTVAGRDPEGISIDVIAIEKLILLDRFQNGEDVLEKQQVIAATKFIEEMYERAGKGDIELASILDVIAQTGQLPEKYRQIKKAEEIVSGRRDVSLDSFNVHAMTCGWGAPLKGLSVDGNKLTIAGKTFDSGIGTHAVSRMILNLYGDAERFKAFVGVDDEMPKGRGSVEFVIKGDGKELWKSGVMTSGDKAKKADVDLKGVKELILEVADGGNGIGSDHADWADAVLVVNGKTPEIVIPEEILVQRYTSVPWRRPIDRIALTWPCWLGANLPPEKVVKVPAADYFPGKVGDDMPRITRNVTIDLNVPFWHSTGLYAVPGEKITVRIPAKYTDIGLRAQIGCHTDTLWHLDELLRSPSVVRGFALDNEENIIASAFGGPVYIAVAAINDKEWGPYYGSVRNGAWLARTGFDDYTPVNVEISGAVEGIRFVGGVTDIKEWKERIRHLSVPIAEIEGKKMIWSFSSDIARQIDDPQEIVEFWDDMMDTLADLAGRPKDKRPAPERFVLDRQISAGGGHSGYPIMAFESWQGGCFNINEIKKEGTWGHLHEIGHNFQMPGWAFYHGQGEVSVNFFSLYGNDMKCGWDMHPTGDIPGDTYGWKRMMSRDYHLNTMKKYFSKDPKVKGKWMEADLGEKLCIYVQLADTFGWDPMKKVIKSFLDEPGKGESDTEKAGEFVRRYSEAAGYDMYPFFFQWGFDMPEEIQERTDHLPDWMYDLADKI